MASACADEQQHKFQPAHQLFLDIPRRRIPPESDEPLFLSDADEDPYSADHFRIYEFKVRNCTRSRSHDWTDCPFAHPGEKARRRCPRQFNYSGTICSDFRRGSCPRGDLCEFAHGVFEYWLHPSRYRTEACKDGKKCPRKVCFFAHTPAQLRVTLPDNYPICAHCRCHSGMHAHHHPHHTISPTSTLNNIISMANLSPPTSPPFSPAQTGPGFSRFGNGLAGSGGFVRRNSMNELVSTQGIYELMNSVPNANCFNGGDEQHRYFGMSDPTRTPSGSGLCEAFSRSCSMGKKPYEEMSMNDSSVPGPDLDWVKDLLA